MFIPEEEGLKRTSSLDNLVNKLQLRKIHNGGRPKGRKNDTTEDRLKVAETAIVEGPTAAARQHKTTISRASLLSKGIVTHAIGSDEQLAEKVVNKEEEIHNKALDIITGALLNLEGKIEDIQKPEQLASIASEMSKIAERTKSRKQGDENSKPQVNVVIYAPKMKGIESYEVVEVVDSPN